MRSHLVIHSQLLSLQATKSVEKRANLLSHIIKESKQLNPKYLEFAPIFAKDLGAVVDCLKSETDRNKIDIQQSQIW